MDILLAKKPLSIIILLSLLCSSFLTITPSVKASDTVTVTLGEMYIWQSYYQGPGNYYTSFTPLVDYDVYVYVDPGDEVIIRAEYYFEDMYDGTNDIGAYFALYRQMQQVDEIYIPDYHWQDDSTSGALSTSWQYWEAGEYELDINCYHHDTYEQFTVNIICGSWISEVDYAYGYGGYAGVQSPTNIEGYYTGGDTCMYAIMPEGAVAQLVGTMNKQTSGDVSIWGRSYSGFTSHMMVWVSNDKSNWDLIFNGYVTSSSNHWIYCGSAGNFRYIAIVVLADTGPSAVYLHRAQVT